MEYSDLKELNAIYNEIPSNDELFELTETVLKKQIDELEINLKTEKEKTFNFLQLLDDTFNTFLDRYERRLTEEKNKLEEPINEIQNTRKAVEIEIEKQIKSFIIEMAKIYVSFLKPSTVVEVEEFHFQTVEMTELIESASSNDNSPISDPVYAPTESEQQLDAANEADVQFSFNFISQTNQIPESQETFATNWAPTTEFHLESQSQTQSNDFMFNF
ncbi:hypothetical protein CHUAL_008434 [Chamberlinius hualienensis]